MFRSILLVIGFLCVTPVAPVQTDNLMANLRDNWESPIGYLETRGYLQVNNETASDKSSVFMTMANATKSFLEKLKQTWSGWVHKHSNSTNIKSTREIYVNSSTFNLEAMKKNIDIDKKQIRCMLDGLKNIKSIFGSKTENDASTKQTTETLIEKLTDTDEPCQNETMTPSTAPKNLTSDTNYITRKLEYLAHLHHPVELVGNPKNEAVNLKKIQALIDRIKYSPDNGMFDIDNDGEKKNASLDPSSPLLLPPYAENYLVRGKRTAPVKSFTEKLNEISKYLNKSLIKGKQQPSEGQRQPSDGPFEEPSKVLEMDDLAIHLSDEQTAAIQKFKNDLNEPPQQFNFDIQPYLEMSPNKLVSEVVPELVTPRTFFEFDDLEKHQDDKRALKPFDFPYVPLNVVAIMHQKLLQRDLMDYNKDANDFVDKYYLLNDGQTNVDDVLPEDEKQVLMPSNLNLEDLSIDLKLNKEFRELEDVTSSGQRHQSDKFRP